MCPNTQHNGVCKMRQNKILYFAFTEKYKGYGFVF